MLGEKLRQSWVIALLLLLLAAGASYVLYLNVRSDPLPEQVIYGNGHIEAKEVRISAEVNGRVVSNFLVEGSDVKKGDVLVQIDDEHFKLERAKTKAEIAAIGHERMEVAQELATWRHHRSTAARDYERYSKLGSKNIVSQQSLEKAEDGLREAEGKVGALKARVAAIEAKSEAAKRALDLVEISLAKTTMRSPINGTALVKAVEIGEFLLVGGTAGVLVDLNRTELKVFIAEKEIGRVHLNDRARVRVDSFPTRNFEGKVIRVDQKAQFTPREVHMPEERARMVFGVTLSVQNPEGALKPGMPADAWILWKQGAPWPERLHIPR